MKKVFLLLLFTSICFAQTKNSYALVGAKMDKIPDDLSTSTNGIAKYINSNFKSENDKIRISFARRSY